MYYVINKVIRMNQLVIILWKYFGILNLKKKNYFILFLRTYGIEPSLVEQILGILLDHLALTDNDPLDIYTVRTIAQFMIEKKTIIIQLLNYTSKQSAVNLKTKIFII